jgi:hypothetical protein
MSIANLTALRNGALAGARALNLAGCGLKEFPSEIFALSDTLEVLDLGFNALSSLPNDLGRLRRLRVLFCSGNHFERLPPALGDCVALSQIGFRGTGMREIPPEALPRLLRWLTLTDNRIETLPDALGQRPSLRKLMLSGNRLRALPESLADAPALELLRIAANRFDTLPSWLHQHRSLAWVGWAGNHLDRIEVPVARPVPWQDLDIGTVLGQGASGVVHQAVWRGPSMADHQAVAVKLFKGAMTSDGLPRHEMAACLAAGGHPYLVGAIGRLSGHPEGQEGLVMPLIPAHWRVLAGPPSLESCTRDVYDPGFRLTPSAAIRITHRIAQALAHMHGRGLLHGDLYAHNILWDGSCGDAVLSDFGAACFLPDASDRRLMGIEVRAFGLLIGELLAASAEDAGDNTRLRDMQAQCLQPEVTQRPMMAGIVDALARADRD